MPGIAGVLRHAGSQLGDDPIISMVGRMRHEVAFVSGHATFAELGVSAGWVCRPDSFAANLPLWNEDRSVCLIFAGQEFSDHERISRGVPLKGENALVPLYEERGAQFVRELNGCFTGLLVDLRKGRAILFNDRYGLGRIYFHESPDGFFFASEAKSLLEVVPRLRELDQRSLAEFWSVGCPLEGRSLFHGISLLPGGSAWTFHRDGRTERARYFCPQEWENQEPLANHEYVEQLTHVFSQAIPRYFEKKSAVGISLTGGLDSRMLLAWTRARKGELPCYTFGGQYRDSADVRIARRLAALVGQPHTTICIENDFFARFEDLAERTAYLTDGTMDVSGAVELYVNERARKIAPIRLTGNYGSEILRSNVAFRPRRLNRDIFTPEFSELLDEAEETYRTESAGHRLSFIAFKQVPWYHYARLAIEQSQLVPRTPFLDNELVALAYRSPPAVAKSPWPCLSLIAAGNQFLAIDTDQALPFRPRPLITSLARIWQDFTAKAEYVYDYGMPQWLASVDRFLAPLRIERVFLGRHKFYHFRVWYRDRLADYVQKVLLDPLSLSRPWLRGNVVRKIVSDHVSGKANHTISIHNLLTVELTRRQLVER